MKNENLVVGANGFLGSYLCKYLISLNQKVTGVYHKNRANSIEGVDYINIEQALSSKKEYTTVYILAAFIPNSDSIDNLDSLFNSNVSLVSKICQKNKNARIVFSSSVSVYDLSNQVLKEDSVISPKSFYGISKFWGEQIVSKHKNYGIVRISSMYGSGMSNSTFLPIIIDNAISKKTICLFGNGEREQNYIHVSDVVKYLYKASLEKKNEIYLAVNTLSHSNREVAEMIKSYLPEVSIKFNGSDLSPSFVYDNSKTNLILAINPKINLDKGVLSLIEWKKK
ncbi:NAD-dependent epimerase/dehydratase family protein [Pseudofulvibacter geojedonensis]|uniref:NAD-dependent epimerase/dehydratase family protein n=1 Tax=Pseudofulvibacter geojedonensis TaxID=1123758 RepID=A0ABW3HYL7_9FLAO